jgi:hypothetical protein
MNIGKVSNMMMVSGMDAAKSAISSTDTLMS